jgi:hypothetical protein
MLRAPSASAAVIKSDSFLSQLAAMRFSGVNAEYSNLVQSSHQEMKVGEAV